MIEYTDFKKPVITSKIKNVKFSRIVADEFSVNKENTEHRPVRDSHVNKIFHSYNGVDNPITVALNKEDNKYHIVDGQHRWFNLKKLISLGHKKQPYRLPCLVLYHEDTGKKLDISIPENRELANDTSFCANEGNERTCVIDQINQVWIIARKYALTKGYKESIGGKLPDGTIEYVSDNWKGYEKLKFDVIKNYISFGKRLYLNGLLDKAIYERWMIPRIIQELDIASGKVKIKTYEIKIKVSHKEFADKNNEDINKLKNNYIHWDKHILSQLTKVNKDITMVGEEPQY